MKFNIVATLATTKTDIDAAITVGSLHARLLGEGATLLQELDFTGTEVTFVVEAEGVYTVSVTLRDTNQADLNNPVEASVTVKATIVPPATQSVDMPSGLTLTATQIE